MKRILLSLIAASSLALMAVAPAGAAAPGACGKSYAILINGALANHINQDGSSTQPGATTAAVGVGVVTFGAASGTGCSITGGELIYNAGDFQTNPAGLLFGPVSCQDDSITGVPCFDGGDHMTGTLGPSPFGATELQLDFTASYGWFNGASNPGTTEFTFTVQGTAGNNVVIGNSVKGLGAPTLSITLEKLNPASATDPLVNAPGFGAAPYLGLATLSCSGYGANGTDGFAAAIAAQTGSIEGGLGANSGIIQIFSNGQAGGSLSFSGDEISQSGFTGSSSSNNDCSVTSEPGIDYPAYNLANSVFADGTSNQVSVVTGSGNDCSFGPIGFIFPTSNVQWGSTNTNSYLILTSIAANASGGAFLTPIVMNTCTIYANGGGGKLTTSNTVATVIATTAANTPVQKVIKVVNTSPVDCVISTALTGTTTDGNCTMSLLNATTDAPGDTTLSTNVNAPTLSCNCTSGTEDDPGPASTVTVSSSNCPIAVGNLSQTFHCTN